MNLADHETSWQVIINQVNCWKNQKAVALFHAVILHLSWWCWLRPELAARISMAIGRGTADYHLLLSHQDSGALVAVANTAKVPAISFHKSTSAASCMQQTSQNTNIQTSSNLCAHDCTMPVSNRNSETTVLTAVSTRLAAGTSVGALRCGRI